MQSNKEKTVFIFEATEGMVLARDVYSPEGRLIVQQGASLTLDLINSIAGSHILEIVVYDGMESAVHEQTYFDKLQATPEFQKFSVEYNNTISNVKSNLNDIVSRNKEINTDELISDTASILTGSRTNLQVFDMLHSLRKNDDLTYVHCINVALIATIIARWINLPAEDIKVLTVAAILHDIGKLMIPEKILLKPGKLTDEEFNTIKTHVNLGFNLLKEQQIDSRIKEACLLHHEKCDGSGYPFNLKGDKIPLLTKIITIADVYDAMTAARVYRGSMCPFDVIKIMEDDAFSKYDPNILIPFLNNVVSSYLHTNVRLSDGRIGEVVLINSNRLSRPSIMCEGEFIDLSKRPDLTIKAIL
ncbi:MAG: HD-GYP domain-containing protein [Bacteroides sp.]